MKIALTDELCTPAIRNFSRARGRFFASANPGQEIFYGLAISGASHTHTHSYTPSTLTGDDRAEEGWRFLMMSGAQNQGEKVRAHAAH